MKFLLLTIIKVYWKLIPAKKRRRCLFSESCSNYVYRKTTEKGFSQGFKALKLRFHDCRSGYQYIELKGEIHLITKTGRLYKLQEIRN